MPSTSLIFKKSSLKRSAKNMKHFSVLCFVLITSVIISKSSAAFDKIVCYYGNWAVYRPGDGKFDVEAIDPNLCTHLIYAFVGINENGRIEIRDPGNAVNNNALRRFTDLKKRNRQLKVLVAIGGWNEGSKVFSQVSKNQSKRRALIDSAVQFLKTYGFDGFDLDWEYPGDRGGDSEDKGKFALWIREFREEFNKHGFLLTAAVGASKSRIDQSYNVPAMNEALDFINLMTYDIHGPYDGRTGHNAPISEVKSSVDAWIKAGMKPGKIVMGVPTYGHSFTLNDARNNGLGAGTSGPGKPGPYTSESGMLGYNEIVELINTNSWSVKYDSAELVPYMHKGNQWISYDDKTSITHKVKYAKSNGLGGVMVWSVETDDFKGKSGETNQIQKTIRRNMF